MQSSQTVNTNDSNFGNKEMIVASNIAWTLNLYVKKKPTVIKKEVTKTSGQ